MVEESPEAAIPDGNYYGITRHLESAAPVTRVFAEIEHEWVGDLRVAVKSPNGFWYILHDRDGGGADDLSIDWAVPQHMQAAGVWTLQVIDRSYGDAGVLRSWGLDSAAVDPDDGDLVDVARAPIPDNSVRGLARTMEAATPVVGIRVDITHSYRGDLRVKAVTPDGRGILLARGFGGGDDLHVDVTLPYWARMSGEWTLLVQDIARGDYGVLESWELVVE